MDFHFLIDIALQAGQTVVETAAEHGETIQATIEEGAHAEEASGGVLGTLGINWMWLVGQLINFAIVLFVLWKWVFKPIGATLEQRREKIEAALADAERIEQEKKEFDLWKQEEVSKARAEAANIVAAAQSEAAKVKDQVVASTKEEQSRVVLQAKLQMEEEERKILQQAKSHVAAMVTTATEKILRKKIDKEEDKRLIKESLDSTH